MKGREREEERVREGKREGEGGGVKETERQTVPVFLTLINERRKKNSSLIYCIKYTG